MSVPETLKSEDREINDDYPGKKGLKKIVALGFEQVVLDVERDVFVVVFTDWYGPCKRLIPIIENVEYLWTRL